ncbi:hypothetical protein WOLCODRAFT_156914 [Wolfiporia cocos MD-104 SS10]|uniref:Uncharacterized protein n=1 Tax=Wolfiporia cocos (strain MD-104) TaxID=742152 RepID=A0A2H3J1R6_WOLCO|nr:hypothetical protein WOLCODRAFT_156914 [Wolfiporia cocos MD-104 SS10]
MSDASLPRWPDGDNPDFASLGIDFEQVNAGLLPTLADKAQNELAPATASKKLTRESSNDLEQTGMVCVPTAMTTSMNMFPLTTRDDTMTSRGVSTDMCPNIDKNRYKPIGRTRTAPKLLRRM